jgi:hypothetical protein
LHAQLSAAMRAEAERMAGVAVPAQHAA